MDIICVGAAKWTPYENKGSDLLTHDGMYAAKITELTEGTAKSGNDTLNLRLTIEDADNRGKRVRKTIPTSGMDSKSNPNVWQFYAMLSNIGMKTEEIQKLEGQKISFGKVTELLRNKICFVKIENAESAGRFYSNVTGLVSQAEYTSATETKTHRGRAVPTESHSNGEARAF